MIAGSKLITQKVNFEFKPKFCLKCSSLGHSCAGRKKMNMQWVPKPKLPSTPPAAQVEQMVIPVSTPLNTDSNNENGWGGSH